MRRFAYMVLYLCILCVTGAYAQNEREQVSAQGEQLFQHTIEQGQTVYSIATMYGVSVDDIYRLNPGSKEQIKSGEILLIPQKQHSKENTTEKKDEDGQYTYHTIKPRETLYSVSVRYQIPATRIIEANPGLSTKTFLIGKTIRIPSLTEEKVEKIPEKKVKTVKKGKEKEYTIKKRETMYSICRKFNVSSIELIKLNPSLKNGLKAGMVIKIPSQETEEIIETVNSGSTVSDEQEINQLLNTAKESEHVDKIKVALLLPFMEDAEYMSSNTKRFVEYYEGLLLAIDSLKSLGCSIDLSVYDTGEGTARTRELLANEASIKEANLIIGAVQNDQIKLISDFAAENKIRYVIPFTSKNDDVLSNAYIYQVNTPHSYLYAKAAEAGCNLFADQNIVILNMEDSKDKKEFLKTFKAEMKNRNISYRQLTYHAETFNEEILSVLDVEKRNVILPSSGTLETLRKIKAPLRSLSEITDPDKQTYMITLFGYPEWQTYAHECLDDFYALNTYIYSTFFVDNLSDEMQEFYHKYKTWYSKNLINISPKYGVLGFDTGMFFLGAMYKYGVNFEENIDKIQYKPIQLGFNFERVNNWGGFVNTNIFIVHYKTDFSTTRTEVK